MTNYNFQNLLSPHEFEVLTRDLLQKHLNVGLIESFTDGADCGIDLRHISDNNNQTIIQCKRYKNYSSLKSNLKTEVVKVKKINPSRYILVTSVGLTPENKIKIIELFQPYIKTTEDILGRNDLNNLLSQYKDIERQHFKLWLASTNVLETILHRDIVNDSEFFLEAIQDKVKFYVQNDSFPEASQLLKNEKYVIISGIPGIGKTTLAEMLIIDLLAQDFQFVYLSNIKNAAKFFDKDKKQIFLYDDFLGSNFLEDSLDKKEDDLIIKFIEKIQKTDNKYLIFTTREYILQQAQQKFEKLDREDFVKCIIDLSKYTKKVKAEIFYNHLFFNYVPWEFVQEIMNQELLFPIIEHQNYNPRIIETFTKQKIWDKCDKEDFPRQIIQLFNNPVAVWEHAFENNITNESRVVMYVFLINNLNTSYHELFEVVMSFSEKFSNKYNVTFNDVQFKKTIKELENTFIKTYKSNEKRIIGFQNPSIQDFLVHYVDKQESLKEDLINNTMDLSLLLGAFARKIDNNKRKLTLNSHLSNLLSDKIILDFDKLRCSKSRLSFLVVPKTEADFILEKLNFIALHRKLLDSEKLENMCIEKMYPFIKNPDKSKYQTSIYFDSINLYFDYLEYDFKLLLDECIYMVEDYEVLIQFSDFRNIDSTVYDEVVDKNEDLFNDIVSDIIDDIYQSSDDINYDESINFLQEITDTFNICTYHERERLIERYERSYDELDDKYSPSQPNSSLSEANENHQIMSMFQSYK